ncbi:MAG: c-type cytochrome [Sphingobacteriales bacterium]|nr:MAG: c-type cytochrome [Sphingobacteriales bacterium]
MKTAFTGLLLFFAFTIAAQQPKNVPSTTSVYNEEGKLQMLITYNPVCNCRTYTEFYHSGRILAKRTFKTEGRKEYIDGEDITYFPDGSIKHFKIWNNAYPEGRAFSNHENGKLEHEEFYENRFKAGTWKYYNERGELLKEVIFEKGRTPWNGKLNIATEKVYAAGKLLKTGPAGKEVPTAVSRAVETNGSTLFNKHCKSCHSPGKGPSLVGVVKRRRPEWLQLMIRDGMSLVQMGDRDAVQLYQKWLNIPHPPFKQLRSEEVAAIIQYLEIHK